MKSWHDQHDQHDHPNSTNQRVFSKLPNGSGVGVGPGSFTERGLGVTKPGTDVNGWPPRYILNMVDYNPQYNWVGFHPLYTATHQPFFHCSNGRIVHQPRRTWNKGISVPVRYLFSSMCRQSFIYKMVYVPFLPWSWLEVKNGSSSAIRIVTFQKTTALFHWTMMGCIMISPPAAAIARSTSAQYNVLILLSLATYEIC